MRRLSKPLINFQFCSDLHFEGRPPSSWAPIRAKTPLLVVAGDVGSVINKDYDIYLRQISRNFDDVLLVPGNHEFFQPDKAVGYDVVETMKALFDLKTAIPNLTILQQGEFRHQSGVRFLGATLWSHIPSIHRSEIQSRMTDYKKIFVKGEDTPGLDCISVESYFEHRIGGTRALTVTDTQEWHDRDVAWLEKELGSKSDPVVVVTHHAPTHLHIEPKYTKYGVLTHAFHSNLLHLMRAPVIGWISGHTHSCFTMKIKNVTCLSNCQGYRFKQTLGYSPERVASVLVDEETNQPYIIERR